METQRRGEEESNNNKKMPLGVRQPSERAAAAEASLRNIPPEGNGIMGWRWPPPADQHHFKSASVLCTKTTNNRTFFVCAKRTPYKEGTEKPQEVRSLKSIDF